MKTIVYILILVVITAAVPCAGFLKSHSWNVHDYGYSTSRGLALGWFAIVCFATIWYIIPFNKKQK